MTPRRAAPRGFVLLNALVLVTALAGAAALLLGRAEGARIRAETGSDAAQLGLYLDAAEALAMTVLASPGGTAVDHAGAAWAQPVGPVPLDRGHVALRLEDLQGRFNVNWLADPEDAFAADAWARFAALTGLPAPQARAIADRLGRREAGAGPVVTLDQLGLDPATLVRLRPLLAALPSDSALNVNTAPPEVLSALVPGLSRGLAERLVSTRATEPFASVQAYTETVLRIAGAEIAGGIDDTRLAVGSRWFGLVARADLGRGAVARRAVIERRTLSLGPRVAYRAAIAPADTGLPRPAPRTAP